MFLRIFIFLLLLSGAALTPLKALAQTNSPTPVLNNGDEPVTGGFAKPYEYERKAYGYDPEGVEYKENQPEDFQVIFITATPFTALFSFGVTGLVSLATRNSFDVGGDYFLPFLAGTFVGSTTIACVSVLTNKYPPPASRSYVDSQGLTGSLVFNVPIITAKF